VTDIRGWVWCGDMPDLIWCSPPCIEFSRESMPWTKKNIIPDMTIVQSCLRIIDDCRTRFWILENVRGAIKWLGKEKMKIGSFYLWGNFPKIKNCKITWRKKESYGSHESQLRAKIPYEISLCVAEAIEYEILGKIK
jgi:site-specific DNA-cytosine methylase